MIEQTIMETVNAHVMLTARAGAACQAEGCPWEWPFPLRHENVYEPQSSVRLDFARHVTAALMAQILGAAEYGVAYREAGRRTWQYPRDGEYGTRQDAEEELVNPTSFQTKLVWRQAAGPWQEVAR